MESVLWSPLTDYHRLSPICHVLPRISFAFYIARMREGEKGRGRWRRGESFRRGESKFAWLAWRANVTVFSLQSASAERQMNGAKWCKAIVLAPSLCSSARGCQIIAPVKAPTKQSKAWTQIGLKRLHLCGF